jgi:hypothetical protein
MNTLFFLLVVAFFLALTLASWAVEKTKWLYLVIFFALPIAAFGYWLDTPGIAWTSMAKLATILLCAIWLWLIRFTNWFSMKTVVNVSFSLLVLNIGEVSLVDAYGGYWMNALAGLFLLFAIPSLSGIKLAPDETGTKNFTWQIPWLWIASYTLWNWTFIVNFFPQSVFTQGAVLLAPILIAAVMGREHWIKGRVHSLSLYLMMAFTWLPVFAMMDISPAAINPNTARLINAASMILAIAAMVGRYVPQLRANHLQTSLGSRGRSKARE